MTNCSSILLFSVYHQHWIVRWMQSLSSTLNSTKNEKFVTNTEKYVGWKVCHQHWIVQCMKSLSPTLNNTMNKTCVTNSIVLLSVGDKLFIYRTIQCWWQTFPPWYYSVLVTNFPFIVLFSVDDKLFIRRTIQCWWQTSQMKSVSPTLNSTMNEKLSLTLHNAMDEKFVTNTE
jgi:hypothetical protein